MYIFIALTDFKVHLVATKMFQHEQLKCARKPHAFKNMQLLNAKNKNII